MGGAETWLMALLRYWREAGPNAPQMEFLATGGCPGVYDEEARAMGAMIHYATYRRSTVARFAGEFRRILHEGRYAALHDHQDFASGWHYSDGAGALPPVRITHVHNPATRSSKLTIDNTPSRRLAAHGRA